MTLNICILRFMAVIRKIKISNRYRIFRRVAMVLLVAYFMLTIPLTGVFVLDIHFRAFFFDYLTLQRMKIAQPKYVFVGDSITAEGLNWGLKLGIDPTSVKSYGKYGYQTHQMRYICEESSMLRPKFVHLLIGTNDALALKDVAKFESDFGTLIDLLEKSKAIIVVTLVPYQGEGKNKSRIDSYNAAIVKMASEKGFYTVDLNTAVSDNGSLLPRFSGDGIHLNHSAYHEWSKLLKAKFKEIESGVND